MRSGSELMTTAECCDLSNGAVGVSQNRASTGSSFRGKAGPADRRSRVRTADGHARSRLWRKPGKLRPPYDVGVFPHMTAKQGAQRGQSEACPPLLPRNCRSSATSAPRTSRSTRWRDALMANRRSEPISARRPVAQSKRGHESFRPRAVARTRGEWKAGLSARRPSRQTGRRRAELRKWRIRDSTTISAKHSL